MANLKPIPDLERRIQEGSIYEGEERVITFRAATFQVFIDTVNAMAGGKVSKTIFYLVGEAIGRRTYEYSKGQAITPDNSADVLDGVLSARGWGRLVSMKKTETPKEVTYESTFTHCIICHNRKAQEPICEVVRGIFAGWLETFVGKKASSCIEIECRAMGKNSCVFNTTFSK